ncbi:MAG: phytanoyl-CoA dioxygenase family protein [Rhodospirillaceae bacterium]|jgi:ectoine hydroxylase-related dioxygenase (phytanoyl-CoA dioxygenase family)|nr:phytanoyl-CoA dioxygenase family protein [Rhodospirillaceae bacterium]
MTLQTSTTATNYERDGFVFPFDIISEDETRIIRADLESAESEFTDDSEKLAMVRSYPARLLPSFDKLIRHPRLIDAVSRILGPDLLVWGSGLFIKEANTPNYVTWHQDLTYWGLDDVDKVTAWVALSPASMDSGCMRFIPGSQKQQLAPHVDTFSENNLLSRGQEVAVDVDESEAVDIVLRPGQASLHHGHLFHASGPNRTGDRRIGAAIRYIKPSMKQETGDRSLAAHVSGEDQFNHFTVVPPPAGRLLDDDFALCRQDMEIKRRVLYEGAESDKGQRYR